MRPGRSVRGAPGARIRDSIAPGPCTLDEAMRATRANLTAAAAGVAGLCAAVRRSGGCGGLASQPDGRGAGSNAPSIQAGFLPPEPLLSTPRT